MRYLVTGVEEPFLTDYFDYPNLWIEGSTVIDLKYMKYTTDGTDWKDVKIDHL